MNCYLHYYSLEIVFFSYWEFKWPVASSLLMWFCLVQMSMIKPINSCLFWPIITGCPPLEEAEAIWLEAAYPSNTFLMRVVKNLSYMEEPTGPRSFNCSTQQCECWNQLLNSSVEVSHMRCHSSEVKPRGNQLRPWTWLSQSWPCEHEHECENQKRTLSFNKFALQKSWCL